MCSNILIIKDKHKPNVCQCPESALPHVKELFANDTSEAEALLPKERFDLILLSLNSHNEKAFSFIRQALKINQGTKVICFGNQNELTKTLISLEKLPPDQLSKLLSPSRTHPGAEQSIAQSIVSHRSDATLFHYKGLVGNSAEIQKLKDLVVKIAPTATTILIQGESGTGKEVIARAVYAHSARSNEVFIPVDCAAINESIIESELFGHAKGAFTGADRNTLGMIRSADKGTLFLDEIGVLPLSMQAKLLRTLQERAVKPVGDTKIYPVDIRIIAATNSNLAEAVKKGTFRQDLYYRLNAITIYAPPLREHRHDIPLLCDYFIDKLIHEGYPAKRFSGSALNALCAYDWPGNIRELENVVRGAVTISHGDLMGKECLSIDPNTSAGEEFFDAEKPASIASHERDAIRKALNQTTGNRRAAAELLGISEATLYRRLKMYSM
jgi:two-component system, NtrC family, response regulator HydG